MKHLFVLVIFVVRLRALCEGNAEWKKDLFLLKENAMYTNYNYLIPEERNNWRSAYEIEIAALKHEERRIQMMPAEGERKAGLMSFFKLPLQMLAILIG
jgi:hypothetical protein